MSDPLPSGVRPKIFKLSTSDPERSIDDPGLALLAAEGWTVAADFQVVIEAPDGERRAVMLVLWPPSRPRVAPRWSDPARWAPHLLVALSALSFGVAMGALWLGR